MIRFRLYIVDDDAGFAIQFDCPECVRLPKSWSALDNDLYRSSSRRPNPKVNATARKHFGPDWQTPHSFTRLTDVNRSLHVSCGGPHDLISTSSNPPDAGFMATPTSVGRTPEVLARHVPGPFFENVMKFNRYRPTRHPGKKRLA